LPEDELCLHEINRTMTDEAVQTAMVVEFTGTH
jgi:hypothetical protein